MPYLPTWPMRALAARGRCRLSSALRLAGWLMLVAAGGWAAAPAVPAPPSAGAVLLTIDGAIGPAVADYLRRGMQQAAEEGAEAIVLRIDTPGGLDTSMREIIRAILGSPVPVLAHVAPSGARAASAGTYLLYASHVAAMAPGTNLGAATPIQIGGGGGLAPAPRERPASGAASAPDGAGAQRGTAEAKAVNDAVAYLRSLAQLRGRNADWAERAVRESVSLPAREALAQNVIDLVAADTAALLQQADGRAVALGSGERTLQTAGLTWREIEPDWRSRMLGVVTNPNLALILMTIGIYGLLFELMNPGALFPGVIGAISLIVGLYALAALPLNFAGMALLLLGLALMVAEGFAPSFGVLGIGGAIAFLFGASLLVDTETPGFGVSLPLLAGVAAAALAASVLIVRLALRVRRRAQVSGAPALVGAPARVLVWSGGTGLVLLAGERWRASGPADLVPGQTAHVEAVRGLSVQVSHGADAAAPVPARSP